MGHRRRGLRAGQRPAVWLEERDVGYVLATRRNDDMIITTMGIGGADELIAALPSQATCRCRGSSTRPVCEAIGACRLGACPLRSANVRPGASRSSPS